MEKQGHHDTMADKNEVRISKAAYRRSWESPSQIPTMCRVPLLLNSAILHPARDAQPGRTCFPVVASLEGGPASGTAVACFGCVT